MKIDVLILGGGPGGAAAAMFLLREGITPVILEQDEFPAFILANLSLVKPPKCFGGLGWKRK